MVNRQQIFLLVLLNSVLFNVISSDDLTKIELVSGLPKPPFILHQTSESSSSNQFKSQHQGIQVDLLREAFLLQNMTAEFVQVPLARNITTYRKWQIDGVTIVPANFIYPGMFISIPYINYQNVAISLKSRNFLINSAEGLSGKTIIAFQKAKKFLGLSYEKVVSYSLGYREIANQNKQIELLFNGSAEVIVLDINIFNYFLKTHPEKRFSMATTVHYIFDERKYAAGFKLEKHRDAFNQGLEKLKKSGQYQSIVDHYLKDNR